jgi:hypothetical protein
MREKEQLRVKVSKHLIPIYEISGRCFGWMVSAQKLWKWGQEHHSQPWDEERSILEGREDDPGRLY